jgi:hypothetical protein
MAALRDASELLSAAVAEAISALDLADADAAAVRLALQYAAVIDAAGRHCRDCDDDACTRYDSSWAMRWIGPLLLDALEQLGATPAARARLKGGPAKDAPVSQLARLRAARRA